MPTATTTDIAPSLEAQRREIERRLDKLGSPVAAEGPAGGNDLDADAAVAVQSQIEHLVTKERLFLHRRALDLAIEREAAGARDICEACDGSIGAARLRALPTATLCVGCARDLEQRAGVALRSHGYTLDLDPDPGDPPALDLDALEAIGEAPADAMDVMPSPRARGRSSSR